MVNVELLHAALCDQVCCRLGLQNPSSMYRGHVPLNSHHHPPHTPRNLVRHAPPLAFLLWQCAIRLTAKKKYLDPHLISPSPPRFCFLITAAMLGTTVSVPSTETATISRRSTSRHTNSKRKLDTSARIGAHGGTAGAPVQHSAARAAPATLISRLR